jgi:hypothetical protein
MTRSGDAIRMLLALGVLELGACTSGAPRADVTCEPHGTRLHIAVLASRGTHSRRTAWPPRTNSPSRSSSLIRTRRPTATHNIHICDSPKDFIGETVIHGRSITCSVPAIPAGTHLFRCDQHPTLMHGVFIVR